MQDQKDETGVLFRNNRKQKETHPDYTGKAMVGGFEYQISAWVKTSSKGNRFMSIAFKSDDREEQQRDTPAAVNGELDDDIPF